MKRIGKRYRSGRADDHYDAIVIGSGIGGLANAALLSKMGKKVCVLEQHYTAGGFTHSYERDGYEWDVGVHYIGEVHKEYTGLRRMFDVISDGNIQWAEMDDCYDRIIIGDKQYDFIKGEANFRAELKKHFPDEADAIDQYVELVYNVARSAKKFFGGQVMSPTMAKGYKQLRRFMVPKETTMTVREVLEGLTSNQELIGVLTGQYGDYGMVPAEATFVMHAAVAKHYFDGGTYPVGGSWKIAENILPVIQASGGQVFTYAKVEKIRIEGDKAVGVTLENGDKLAADQVISSVGARLTYGKLLPEAVRSKHKYDRKLEKVKPSSSTLCMFLAFKGSAKDLNLPKTNLWCYPTANHEKNVADYRANPDAEFPMLYISFPSAKDPAWDDNYPNKSTVQVITLAEYAWFEQWRDTTWNQRGEDYETFKQKLADRMLAKLYEHVPQLEGHLDFYELATPLSTEWFHLYDKGEIYGLDHDPDRFKQDWLHPITPIKGLFMTGQDVVTAGVGGALLGGVMTTAAMTGGQSSPVFEMLKTWKPAQSTEPA